MSTYYGVDPHKIDIDWYRFDWEGININLAVTKDNCVPITEHIETSNRITDYNVMEVTLGVKNMSVFDIPVQCQQWTDSYQIQP